MNEAAHLIHDMQAFSEVEIIGERVKLSHGYAIPNDLMERAKKHKGKLIQALRLDGEAKAIGMMVGIPGTLYTLTLGKHSALYMEVIEEEWVLWWENYFNGRRTEKTIAIGDFIDVLDRAYNYVEYIKERRQL